MLGRMCTNRIRTSESPKTLLLRTKSAFLYCSVPVRTIRVKLGINMITRAGMIVSFP